MRTAVDHALIYMVMDGLIGLCPNWLDGDEFSINELTVHVSGDDSNPSDVMVIEEALNSIAEGYDMKVMIGERSTGKYAVFAKKQYTDE